MIVAGIGTALPEHALAQDDAAELHASFCGFDAKRTRTLRALYRRAGVSRRHSVVVDRSEGLLAERQVFYPPARGDDDPGPSTTLRMEAYARHAPQLALRAARRALENAGVAGYEVTHLVSVSCTGFVSPGVDGVLMRELGLPANTERTHIGFMGCHGSLNALRVARSLVAADPTAVPLVCSVELCSLHFSYGWDTDMLVANALFADGAAALVGRSERSEPGGATPKRGATPMRAATATATAPACATGLRVVASGSTVMPDSTDAMTWRVGDAGFRMTLSAAVPTLIERDLRPWLSGWLADHGVALADVRSWAVHPGGPRILDAVSSALDLPPEATRVSRDILGAHGNMSSATVLFILDAIRAAGGEAPCVALAFGPGLTAEATLLA